MMVRDINLFYKVRTYEKVENFVLRRGNKVKKFVEAAKGTNLFFAVYESIQEDEATGKQVRKRTFATIPLNEVIKRKKQGLICCSGRFKWKSANICFIS